MSFDIHPTLASISLPIPLIHDDVPSPTFHFHSNFPQYNTHFAISILLLLLILCMLSILLVLNHHFCSVPNNLIPSIHSSTIYHFLSLLLIAMCRPNRPHFAPSKGIKSFSIFIYHRRHRRCCR